MRILGIDPGLATVGWGVIDMVNQKPKVVGYGVISTPKDKRLPERLTIIEEDLKTIINKFQPDEIALEELFFNTNITTGINVAQARGVILLTAVKSVNGKLYEYTPLQIKQALTGYGRAEKRQVMELTKQFLGLSEVPKPDDTADALALAICHAYSSSTSYAKLVREAKQK